MKKSIKIAAAFVALAGLAGTAQAADGDRRGQGPRHGLNFERADADQSGDVTFEEFQAVLDGRFADTDKDGDGKMTVGEIADQILRKRAERQAQRLIERFDIDGDGALTTAEIESRQKKMFALLDRNDDGKIVKEELPRRGGGRHGDRR